MSKFSPILAVIADLSEQFKARRARIESAYSEANSGKEPTRDGQGRYHAPCDGYMLPDGWADLCLGDYSGRLFGRGEYLPIPCTDAEHEINRYFAIQDTPFGYKAKAKALVSDIAELKALKIRGLEIGQGKSWVDDSGNETAYAYLEGLKSIIDAATGTLEALYQTTKVKGPETYIEGRLDVVGIIVAIKVQTDPMYGPSRKMLVTTAEGAKLWGTMPSALPVESKGKQVSFTATFTPGRDGMSYFKRPACAMILGE